MVIFMMTQLKCLNLLVLLQGVGESDESAYKMKVRICMAAGALTELKRLETVKMFVHWGVLVRNCLFA